jgi:hypothetical protein
LFFCKLWSFDTLLRNNLERERERKKKKRNIVVWVGGSSTRTGDGERRVVAAASVDAQFTYQEECARECGSAWKKLL